MFCKKGVLRNFAKFEGRHLCQSLFLNKVAGLRSATLLKRETLAQVFSSDFCKIAKNNFFYRTPLVAASVKCSSENVVYLLTRKTCPKRYTGSAEDFRSRINHYRCAQKLFEKKKSETAVI